MESEKTIRLFEQDPYQTEFQAEILTIESTIKQSAVVLNQTCFYPESGGQPCDSGEIDNIPVVKVFEEGDAIVHLLEKSPNKKSSVHGKINWNRRFDHMQQHTGQHILSQAFVQCLQAKTIGFHLSEKYSTIDLDISVLAYYPNNDFGRGGSSGIDCSIEEAAQGVFQNVSKSASRKTGS